MVFLTFEIDKYFVLTFKKTYHINGQIYYICLKIKIPKYSLSNSVYYDILFDRYE